MYVGFENGGVRISVTTYGVESTVFMGEYNAWRVFAVLALLFGVALPKKVQKRIML